MNAVRQLAVCVVVMLAAGVAAKGDVIRRNYVAVEIEQITDERAYNAIAGEATKSIERAGGRYLTASVPPTSLIGEAPKRLVMIRFRTPAEARRWTSSADVRALGERLRKAAKVRVFTLGGID